MIHRVTFIFLILFSPCYAMDLVDDFTHGFSLTRPKDDELNGSLAIAHVVQLGIYVPGIENMFLGKSNAEFEEVLCQGVEETNTLAALYMLHFISAGWLEMNKDNYIKARRVLKQKAKTNKRQSTFINPYLKYYTQALRFTHANRLKASWFTHGQFKESYLLKLPFQLSSLVMEVYGGLMQIQDDAEKQKISATYFTYPRHETFLALSKPYETLILAHAFLKEERLLPRSHFDKFEQLLQDVRSALFERFADEELTMPSQLNGFYTLSIEEFLLTIEGKVDQWLQDPALPEISGTVLRKSCLKKDKKPNFKKEVHWAPFILERDMEHYPLDENGNVPKNRAPSLSNRQQTLWYQLMRAFQTEIPLRAVLQRIYQLTEGLSFTIITRPIIEAQFSLNKLSILDSDDLRDAMSNAEFQTADSKKLRRNGAYLFRYTDSEIAEDEES